MRPFSSFILLKLKVANKLCVMNVDKDEGERDIIRNADNIFSLFFKKNKTQKPGFGMAAA